MADKRSYEKDLWDGIKQVYDRYDEGKKTLSEMHKFLAERAKIEEHYAKGLQALASGKPGGSTEARTIGAAWGAIKQDHEAQQRLRANLAQTITKDLVGDLGNFKKEATKQKETLSTTVANLNKDLEKGKATVTKAKQNYHAKSESAENALLNYEKAQQDPTHPPKTLTKLNTTAQKAKKEAEVADAAYQQSVQEFQQFQLKYQESMKTILNEFQMLEERRTVVLRDNMEKLINAQDALLVELQRSNQQVQEVVAEINGLQDVQDWISENKTGLVPSKPTEYEPYKWQFEHPSVPASQKSKIASSSGASVKKESGSSTVSTSGGASVAKKTSAPSTAESSRDAGAESSGGKKAKANYDYSASDDTEISFDVDDIILVHKIDDSGWWEGEIRGKRGLFPGNYVELIESSGAADNVKKCRAVYEFKGDNDDELSIAVGDIIVIDSETEGWYSGTNSKGKSGMFPANYVELL